MLHDKNLNTINIDKILDEARNRKSILELEEIETLLQNKTSNNKSSGYWKNISLLVLALLIGAGISIYYFANEPVMITNNSIISNQGKIENQPTKTVQKDGNNVVENPIPGLVYEKKTAVNEQAHNLGNIQDKARENPYITIEKNTSDATKPASSNNKNESGFSVPEAKKEGTTKYSLKGWELSSKVPSQFKYGLDDEIVFKGNASAYITSKKSNYNSAWLTQEMSAAQYAGKRLRMSAMVKSDNIGKKAWAGIFMNIKGNNFKQAGYDNLYDKNIMGKSDWVACELVMDIPANTKKITFGLYKVYGGNAWIDNIGFEVVSTDVPLHFQTQTEAQDTSLVQPDLSSRIANIIVEKPSNLDLEMQTDGLPHGWHIGEEKQHFRVVKDDKIFHSGASSVFLQSSGYIEKDWNTLMQYCNAGEYAGKRLKLTAWLRTEDLKEYAQFIFRVDGSIARPVSETIKEINFTGNNNWREVELTLDIPEEATIFSYGILLAGKGKIWMDDISIEEVAVERSKRKTSSNKSPINLDFEE